MAIPQLFIALTAEGPTDVRFLSGAVRNAVEDILVEEAARQVDVEGVLVLETSKIDRSFSEYVQAAVEDAYDTGAAILLIHSDADRDSYSERYDHKFRPAFQNLSAQDSEASNYFQDKVVPVIPVRMIEAWMLADMDLFRQKIGTNLPVTDLGLDGNPESMADPKDRINQAFLRVNSASSRNRRLCVNDISQLYEPLGNAIPTSSLMRLDSYQKFRDELRKALRALGYIQ